MIDISRYPLPDDPPEPGACIRIERPEDGLAVLVLDPPHHPSLALIDLPLLRDLDLALSEIAEDGSLRGLVVTGRAPLSFAGGADIHAILECTDAPMASEVARLGSRIFGRLGALGREQGGRLTTVAAVGGAVPGGACELSLACDRIVLADHPKSVIGLPEVKLGVLPAWGGSTRLPRRVGLMQALDAVLGGKLLRARKAYKIGLVDRLTQPEYLTRVATDIALGRQRCPSRRKRGLGVLLVDKNPLVSGFVARKAADKVRAATGGHYPAPLAVLPILERAQRTPLDASFDREAEAVGPISVGPVCKNLARLFLLSEAAKGLGKGSGGARVPRASRVTVIGAGIMGGGAASLLAEKGFDARLCDLSQDALDAAEARHRAEVAKKLRRRHLQPHEADGAIDRLEVTAGMTGLARCDFAIEAVAEKLEVKRAVFGELASRMPADAVLATNTSSLSVEAIAEGVPNPERVVGMHFFNPVRRMPLVEIVRGPATSDETVARTARLALDLGKTPVVVADVAGFLVNRLLGPYLDEALHLFAEGAEPRRVDGLLRAFGMPMGPFELLDEVGLDIASHAAQSLFEAYGERMTPSQVLAPLLQAGDLGKKTGAGVYLWGRDKKGRLAKRGKNGLLARPAEAPRREHADEEIVDRTVLAMVNEAARCLSEGVVQDAGSLDLATVFGTGFAPFRGGVLRYAEQRGRDEVVRRLQAFAELDAVAGRPGGAERFRPSEGLTAGGGGAGVSGGSAA